MSGRALSIRGKKKHKKMRWTSFPNNKTHHNDKTDGGKGQDDRMESDCVHYSG